MRRNDITSGYTDCAAHVQILYRCAEMTSLPVTQIVANNNFELIIFNMKRNSGKFCFFRLEMFKMRRNSEIFGWKCFKMRRNSEIFGWKCFKMRRNSD